MSALETKIDELYALPLDQFTAARNTLAKDLSGEDASRVKRLAKPTVIPWAINQVYWHARPAYEHVLKTGARLRQAQIDALKGKPADLRAASTAHRDAIAEAVKAADRLASNVGSRPAPDALTRSFEALSLAAEPPAQPGRLVQPLQPSGFEALTGITPRPPAAGTRDIKPERGDAKTEPRAPEPRHAERGNLRSLEPASRRGAQEEQERRARAREEAATAKQAAAEQKKRDAEIKKAEAALAHAQAAERLAHAAWLHAQEVVDEARQRLTRTRARPS